MGKTTEVDGITVLRHSLVIERSPNDGSSAGNETTIMPARSSHGAARTCDDSGNIGAHSIGLQHNRVYSMSRGRNLGRIIVSSNSSKTWSGGRRWREAAVQVRSERPVEGCRRVAGGEEDAWEVALALVLTGGGDGTVWQERWSAKGKGGGAGSTYRGGQGVERPAGRCLFIFLAETMEIEVTD